MGKRKRSRSRDRDYNDIIRELKKIKSKSRKRRRSLSSSTLESDNSYKHKRYYDYEFNHDDNEYEDYNVDYQGEHNPDIYSCEYPEAARPELVEAGPSSSTMHTAPAPGEAPALGEASALDEAFALGEAPAPLAGPAPTETPAAPGLAESQGHLRINAENITTENPDDETVPSLKPEILELLGEDPADNKKFGENLHKDIASRWTHILTNGLTKDTQVELNNRYLPPENCPNMKVPILNLEVKAALLEINVKKDFYSQSRQNQLSSSLAAIGQVLNWALSSKDVVPPNIIKTLSDAGRLICDSHFRESQSRRFAALNTLNKNIRDTIKNTRIDEHLFGSALSEHIRSSKAINKTGSEMKSTAVRPTYRPQVATQHQQRGALNSRGAPPRVPAAAEQRMPPAPRRPPRDRRERDAPRGRRSTGYTRHHTRRRY